jgi:hypothetical protein
MINVIAVSLLIMAGLLAALAVFALAFIPFATEIEDVLGPLIGAVAFLVSAAALAIDSRELQPAKLIPRASDLLLHLSNLVAILLICLLVVPSLTDIVYRFETKLLICVGLVVSGAYITAIWTTRTQEPKI